MQLFRWKYFPVLFMLQLACADGTAPLPGPGYYLLQSVGGSPLPAVIMAGNGYTTEVIWSTLSLQPGSATLTERWRQTPPSGLPTESVHTTRYSYTISNERLLFDYDPPCPPNALCVEPPVGEIVGSTLILRYGTNPAFRPPSLFRLAGPD